MTGEGHRPEQDLDAAYDRFVRLMDRVSEAIDRKAVDQVGALKEQVDSLTSEMQALFLSAVADPSAPQATTQLRRLILQAVERLSVNQIRLTRWLDETSAGLGRLHQGAVVVHSYGATVRSGLPLFEQQA